MKINDDERKVLAVLADARADSGTLLQELCRHCVVWIGPQAHPQLARSLSRKGLAEYGRGLWNDDGEVAGSGYCCTKQGAAFLAEQLSRVPEHKPRIFRSEPGTTN